MSLQHANVPKQEEDRMRTAKYRVALLLAAVLANGSALPIASAAGSESQAISGIVSGNVQKVGFRAMILKRAIEYNLAGSARNTKEGNGAIYLARGRKSDRSGCNGYSQWNQEIFRCECQHVPSQ